MTERKILLGNEAIAHGLLESACTMATSYPGTPASEVLGALVKLKKQHSLKLHLEWSINEKVAFEVALANSFTGRRSAVIVKQVGLSNTGISYFSERVMACWTKSRASAGEDGSSTGSLAAMAMKRLSCSVCEL